MIFSVRNSASKTTTIPSKILLITVREDNVFQVNFTSVSPGLALRVKVDSQTTVAIFGNLPFLSPAFFF